MYDLLTAFPHVPDDARFTAADFEHYRNGYQWALVMALRVMDHAERRYQVVVQTKRLEARARRKAQT